MTNQTLNILNDIENAIVTECAKLDLGSHEDRARLSWWIFNNFVAKDYRVTFGKIKNPSSEVNVVPIRKVGPFPGKEEIPPAKGI